MKNNILIAIALLIIATANVSAEQTKLANAMQKASEIMRTGKGSLTQEESAMLAAAGILYTKETVQNSAQKVTTPAVVTKNNTLTDHEIFVAKFFLNLFGKVFDNK
ncbi:MAG TPA: hypothetical protein VL201_00675 [Patescibacteria group bacterium]|jgi:hypothetical protein|nr:hypothetical protein [Patescibacteria group bacterium]